MSNFRYRLRETTKQLAIGEGDVKNRLMLAATNHLIFANVPADEEIPKYFRDKLETIMATLTKRSWSDNTEGDLVRATIHSARFKTIAKIANEVWILYNEFEEFLHSGFIPEESS